ncbi:MAG: PEP/pyruvate-binding domain-containing protein [Lachnospiraceae bacterium]|nr:PEP/pyruvate-binding domain-containing protein [Lachnospiraceae bacterium]
MNTVLDFQEIKKEDVMTAGGKGANLGEMTAAGIAVPGGFVVTADAYKAFIKENHLEEMFRKELTEAGKDEAKLLDAAKKFRHAISKGKLPEEVEKTVREKYAQLGEQARVAVRSSATAEDLPDASFAGQQETYLNVRGAEAVLTQIRNCYASLWGNRAVCYRSNQGYDQLSVALAVVIQKMVESEKAGVLFTVNPINQNADEMQINASYGLGESVVSGKVTADSYLCDKQGKVKSCQIGSKETQIIYADTQGTAATANAQCTPDDVITSDAQKTPGDTAATKEVAVSEKMQKARCLNDEEITALCAEAVRIEKHYGCPMDIEWAIAGGSVYILQARAITTLHTDNAEEQKIIAGYLEGMQMTGKARANMAFQLEKMPFAYRPLDYDYIIKINRQKANIFRENGIILTSDPRIDDDGIQTLPTSQIKINGGIFKLFGTLKLLKNFAVCTEKCRTFLAEYEDEIGKMRQIDFEQKNIKECGEFLSYTLNLIGRLAYDRFKYALFPSFIAGDMEKAVQKVDKSYTKFDLFWGLNNKTSEVTRDIAELAGKIKEDKALAADLLQGANYQTLYKKYPEMQSAFDSFLQKNGYKSDYNCYCVDARTLLENPDRLLHILQPLVASTETASGEKEQDFGKLMEQLKTIYGSKYPALKERIEDFRYFHVVREETQYLWETVFYYVRKCLERTNMLLLSDTDYEHGVANLFAEELIAACERGSLSESDKEKIERRNSKHPLAQKVWDASKLLVFDADGDVLKGVSGSTGTAIGKVCIIHGPEEFYKMQKGDVLVCQLTDPEWTPLFNLASAVVADTGSSLSHAAIVAREYGIPAVLGVGFATTRFKDGDTIKVDGDKGEVSGC